LRVGKYPVHYFMIEWLKRSCFAKTSFFLVAPASLGRSLLSAVFLVTLSPVGIHKKQLQKHLFLLKQVKSGN
jgi:hypothetical protein